MPARRRRSLTTAALAAFLLLLAASHVVRLVAGRAPAPEPGGLTLREVDGERMLAREISLAILDRAPDRPAGLPILLLHGSPGSRADFHGLVPTLAASRRVIAPDLPGFGGSTHDVADYSIRAHARYALAALERLAVDRLHVVGFSMGGGVALELYDLAPRRVASLTMLSAIGVQELELFGDHRVNHLVHGGQLALLVAVREGLPHFGRLDRAFVGVPYARNFFDSDQRPLRGVLRRVEPPLLILHGREDFLVPVAAAREHHRLVPHSELALLPASHFFVFTDGPATARRIEEFVERVERGGAPARGGASAARVAAAARPFDPRDLPPLSGFALVLTMALFAAATFVSEDLACIGAGLMVGHGRIGWSAAVVACFVGILGGDLLLFLAGRHLGRPALARAPLRWLIRPETVELCSHWFARRGPAAILLSRFVPGTRTPTYFTAGLLHTRLSSFALWFLLAVAVWTPLLVGLAALVGDRAFGYLDAFRDRATWLAPLAALAVLLAVKLILPLVTFRGRRRVWGRLRRTWSWEFWPPWIFYPPVVAWIVWLGLRHRSPLLFTAANPAIQAGGFVAESKGQILAGLAGAGDRVARTATIPAAADVDARVTAVRDFRALHRLDFPVVLKPDAGQRGSGVLVARSEAAVRAYLERAPVDVLVQEYVPGPEFGVFYYRLPGAERGHVFSVTEKLMPEVVGDGRRTIEELILLDPRAVTLAGLYLARQAHQAGRVPAPGERVALVELGTHCRGAVFLDGARLLTPALEQAIDTISRGFAGFHFGRYDLRAPSAEALSAGTGFKIIELNGVTSEATHIYDPRTGLLAAWRTLAEQWSLAFEIGRRNRDLGVSPARAAELWRLWRRYRELARGHPG